MRSPGKINLKTKKTLLLFNLILILLVLISLGLYNYFKNAPRFAAGAKLHNYSLAGKTVAEAKADLEEKLIKSKVVINFDNIKIESNARELGVRVNEQSLQNSLNNIRNKSAYNFVFHSTSVDSPYDIERSDFARISNKLMPQSNNSPVNASYILNNGEVIILPGNKGLSLDFEDVRTKLISEILNENPNIIITTQLIENEPVINKQTLESLGNQAEVIAKLDYNLKSDAKEYRIENNQILPLLIPTDDLNNLTISSQRAKELVNQVASQADIQPVDEITSVYKSGKPKAVTTIGQKGRKVNNITELSDRFVENLNNKQSYSGALSFSETNFNKKEVVVDDTIRSVTYTYKIIQWGNLSSSVDDFTSKVAQTLADGRGWAQAGINFIQVTGPSDFDIVLSEPSELPARYPGTCDSTYSCRVGRYVIINDDRWRLATPSWNNSNGSLRDYQHMVVNHEVGHRLGRGHEFCSGPGNLAPVMQQQSIDLQGCKFNPWPLSLEISAVKNSL